MDARNRLTRVFVVDDHPAIRSGLALVLERQHFTLCAEDSSPVDALAKVEEIDADIALVDLSYDEGNAFELIAAMREKGLPVLVYSMHEDTENIERSFFHGALGYVTKREDTTTLLEGMRAVLRGERYLSPRAAKALEDHPAPCDVGARCSTRELQILEMLGQGLGKADIAQTLAIGVRTVETYCNRLCEKLALPGMKELRQFAIRNRFR